MTILLHFVSIFASLMVLALALAIIQVMIGTYQDRILSALKGQEPAFKTRAPRVTMGRRSLLLLPA